MKVGSDLGRTGTKRDQGNKILGEGTSVWWHGQAEHCLPWASIIYDLYASSFCDES